MKSVEVPPAASGSPPFDLGSLEMTVHRSLEVGRPAPGFSLKTLDGKEVRLEDYRGKIVLLEFWATWCGPCRAQTPALKKLHEELAKDGRFAILGLSLDEDVDAVREYTKTERIPWTQGLLGEWNASVVRAQYGVAAVPSMVIVGRDGNVLVKGLMAAIGVKQFVTEALLKEPAR